MLVVPKLSEHAAVHCQSLGNTRLPCRAHFACIVILGGAMLYNIYIYIYIYIYLFVQVGRLPNYKESSKTGKMRRS